MSNSTGSYHERREHPRVNPNKPGEFIHVDRAVVKNPTRGETTRSVDRSIVEGHGDALMGLIEPEGAETELVEGDPVELSEEERRESASLLNRLMGGRVVDDLGNPVDEQAAKLFTIKNLIESLKIRVDDDGEVDDIVFALESPEWTSRGFGRKDHFPWAALGLGPEMAARWRDAEFTPYNVGDWLGSYGRVEPEQAKHYFQAGVDERTARTWNSYSFEGADAVKWIAAGVDVYDAARWRSSGIPDVDEARDWQALGVNSAQEAGVLKSLGSEAAQRWVDADVENLSAALNWNKYVKPGYTEKDLAPFVKGDIPVSAEVFEKWQEENVPASEIATFLEKGYTPKRAVSRIKKGKTAAQAEDLRAGELVPGKAWKEIKAGLKRTAQLNGYSEKYSETRTRGNYGMVVDVELSSTGPTTGAGRAYRRYSFKFTNTGRFISGEGSGMWRPVRKVSDVVTSL